MKPKYLLSFLVILIMVLSVLAFATGGESARWYIVGIGGTSLIMCVLLYQSVVKPVTAARRGLELLAAQDFNNRLVKVHEPGADKIVALFNDLITRLKNERLRLREQDTFLRLLIDASPMGIILLNLEGKVTMVNDAFLKISEIAGKDIITGKPLKEVDTTMVKSLLSLQPGENKVIRQDGSRMFKLYHLWFIQEGFRRHFYLVESLTDELRIAEKEAYEKVIRMISHEVNNTMGSVQSILETLADETSEDSDLCDTIESCRERCEMMCGFIDSFADLARIPEPVFSRVNIDNEITKMLPFLRLMAPESVEISFNNENAIPSGEKDRKIINADMTLLQQAIVNIVKNAVEGILERIANENRNGVAGHIRIVTEKDDSGVHLTIANDGEPISAETASHLFSPFYSTKKSGRGLGLTLVSDVLRKHNCSFKLRTDDDSITRFSISFLR